MIQHTNPTIRFLVVHDDLVTAQCRFTSLQSAAGFELLGYARPGVFDSGRPAPEADLIFIDSRIGRERVSELTRRFTSQSSKVRIIIIGADEGVEDLAQYSETGAVCSVPGDAPVHDLIAISRSAASRQASCPPSVAFGMFERLSELSRERAASEWIRSTGLTPRELDILRMLGEKPYNEDLASSLCLSVATVKSHVHRILLKLDVCSRMEAAACFRAATNAKGSEPDRTGLQRSHNRTAPSCSPHRAANRTAVTHSGRHFVTDPPPIVLVLSGNRLCRDMLAAALSSDFDVIKAFPEEPARVDLVAAFVQELNEAVQIVQEAKRTLPYAPVVLVGGNFTEEQTVTVIEAGASASLNGDAALTEVVAALEAVSRGQTFCSARIASMVFTRVASLANSKNPVESPLTAREEEVLERMQAGLSNKEIAHNLSISISTVKNHVHLILSKFKVSRRSDLIDWQTRLNAPVGPSSNGYRASKNGRAASHAVLASDHEI